MTVKWWCHIYTNSDKYRCGEKKKKIGTSTDPVNILRFFCAKLIRKLNRWMRGQLVSVWGHVMLMCNRYLVVVCVIRALLSLFGLDDISMLAIRVTDLLLQIGQEIEFELLSKYHHACVFVCAYFSFSAGKMLCMHVWPQFVCGGVCMLCLFLHLCRLSYNTQMCISIGVQIKCRSLFICLIPIMPSVTCVLLNTSWRYR